MKMKRLNVLAIEIFKTINSLNPNYMKDIFTAKLHAGVRPDDILVKHHNIVTCSAKSLKTLGPKVFTFINLPIDMPFSL